MFFVHFEQVESRMRLKITLRNPKRRKPLDNRSKPRRRSLSGKNNTRIAFAGLACVFGSLFVGMLLGNTIAAPLVAVSGAAVGL